MALEKGWPLLCLKKAFSELIVSWGAESAVSKSDRVSSVSL